METRPLGTPHFRYVQSGGAFTEASLEEGQKERSLWFYATRRRVRSAAEARVIQSAEKSLLGQSALYLIKSGAVLPKDGTTCQRCVLGDT